MTNSNTVYVYVKLSEASEPVIGGRLVFFENRIDFRYAKSWIDNPTSFPFHPELLPLTNQDYTASGLNGALSVFKDGAGAWGRALINKIHGQVELSEYLTLSNNLLRIGVFRYSRERERFSITKNNAPKDNQFEICQIYDALRVMESGKDLTDLQASILEHGSSMDGMRPKSFVKIGGDSWIVKFPSSHDYGNNAVNELIGMRLANACGIETPEVKLIPLGGVRSAIAIKRFDTNGMDNFPLMSTASAMGFVDGETSKKDYRYIAQTLTRLTKDAKADCLSLFKRMALNVMISNKDDHIFNQAIIRKDGHWRLSPVYDVVCGEGSRRSHAMTIGEHYSSGSLVNVLSSASSFGLSNAQAETIVSEMLTIVSEQWEELALSGGASSVDITQIQWAILHKDIFVGYDAVKADLPEGGFSP